MSLVRYPIPSHVNRQPLGVSRLLGQIQVAVVTGRIMSSLVQAGGLAGKGGIAGRGGGLAG